MAKPTFNTTLAQSSATTIVPKPTMSSSKSGPAAKVSTSLERSWRDVDQQFFEQTGRHLMSSGPGHKAGVMEMWQTKYQADASSETARKHKQIADVMQSILDGVEVVGAFAAQAASTVFAPASMCFNAFAFLIDVPRQIKKVYDGLKDLFEEVSDFLVKFKILKRIDDERSLDEDLIMNTNKVLMSFVRICTLSIRLLEGSRLMVAAKVVFLKDDSGVSAELGVFRRLTQSQSTLTGTVTLEHVMRSEQDVKSILESSFDMNAKITSLAAASSDEKTRVVNRQRLEFIARKLFPRGNAPSTETPLPLCADMNALLETLQILMTTAEWREWIDQTELDRRIVATSGPSNTGKSFLLGALKEKLDNDRQNLSKDAPSMYVCHHNFSSEERVTDDRSNNGSMSLALKSIAFQVASQSTTYASELERHLQRHGNVRPTESIDELWDILGLYKFPAPADSTLFILLDNIDQEDDGMVKVFLENILDCKRKSSSVPNVRVRVFLTATTIPHISRLIPELKMQELNTNLINAYITRGLQTLRIFQDRDKKSVTRRQLVQEELSRGSAGRFNIVRQKLEMLRGAIDEDAPEEKLSNIIQANIEPDEDQQSQQVLERLEASLRPQHIEQLNVLLMWTTYRRRGRFSFAELEAALYLSDGTHTLEPLFKKIQERFNEVFIVLGGEYIDVRKPILEILKRDEDNNNRPSSADNNPLFSLSISVQNAAEKDIRRFVWDLNEQMVSGKFDFSTPHKSTRTYRIKLNRLDAHLKIIKACLKLLNEEPRDATQALLEYARDYLPIHLTELRGLCDHLSATDHASVSQGLIQYLSDPFYLEYEHRSCGDGKFWLKSSDDMASICFWLDDPTTIAYLQPREMRWVRRAKESNDQAWFMSDVATAIARKWIGCNYLASPDRKSFSLHGPFYEMYEWLQSYTTASSVDSINPHASSALSEIASTRNEDSATTTGSGSDESTILQQAPKVVDWVQARLNDHSDMRRSMLIGVILFSKNKAAEAVEQFSKCLSDANHKRNALLGLGRCKKMLQDYTTYRSTLTELLAVMRTDRDLGRSSQDDLKEYMNTLKELSLSYAKDRVHDQALRLCEDALKEFESDNDCRWIFVTSLYRAGREEQLLTLLEDWTRNPERHGGKSPSQSFFEWIDEFVNCLNFNGLLERIQNDNLLSSFAKIIEGATGIANGQQSRSYSALLFFHGLANLTSHDDSKFRKAIDLWEELTQTPQPADPDVSWEWRWYHGAASDSLIQYKFDTLRETARTEANSLPPGVGRTPADVERVVTELKSYIKFVRKNLLYLPTATADRANKYVTSTYVILGRQDLARKHTRQDMADHLEIMSDDDPDNDSPAVKGMFGIFCLTNDVNDATSAWSLLDHGGHRDELFRMDELCSLCGTTFGTDPPESRWICQFCLSYTCHDCYREGVVQRTPKKRGWSCSPNHEFIELRRWYYTEEEKVPGKIRVDFKIGTDENGRSTRLGGRVIDVSEWLEQVRVKWGLPPPSSTTRAQK